MQRLPRTELALGEVKNHLASSGVANSALTSYLAQYLAVCFYCEVEEKVKEILCDRLRFTGDQKLEYFVKKQHEKMLERVKKSDLVCVLELFGEDCRSDFDGTVEERDVSYYSNAITGRHNTCHNGGSNLTINDIELALPAANTVLDALESVIR